MKSLQDYFDNNFDIYYSGADVSVFIGNILLDEVTMIGWNKINTAMPSFAYNKDKFTTVLHGKTHIEGKIAVNFITPGYLEYAILKSNTDPQKQLGVTTNWKTENPILEAENERNRYYYYTYKRNQDTPPSDKIKDAMRNYIWGNSAEKIDNTKVYDMVRDRYFNMILIFGNPVSEEYSIRTIVDAKLIGDNMEIAPDGSPVQIIYSFVARLADTPIKPKYKPPKRTNIGTKAYLHNVEDYIHDLGANIVKSNIVKTMTTSSVYLPAKAAALPPTYPVPIDTFDPYYTTLKTFNIRINTDQNSLSAQQLYHKLLLPIDKNLLFNTDPNNGDFINAAIDDVLIDPNTPDNIKENIKQNLPAIFVDNIVSIFQYPATGNYIDYNITVNIPINNKWLNKQTKLGTTAINSTSKLSLEGVHNQYPLYMQYNNDDITAYGNGMPYLFFINDPDHSTNYHNLQQQYPAAAESFSYTFYDEYYPISETSVYVVPNLGSRVVGHYKMDIDKFERALQSYVEVLFKEVYYADGLYLTGQNINKNTIQNSKSTTSIYYGNIPNNPYLPETQQVDMQSVLKPYFEDDDFEDYINSNLSLSTDLFLPPMADRLRMRQTYITNPSIIKEDIAAPLSPDRFYNTKIGMARQLAVYELQRKTLDTGKEKFLGPKQNMDSELLLQIDVKDSNVALDTAKNTRPDHSITILKELNSNVYKVSDDNVPDAKFGANALYYTEINTEDRALFSFYIQPIKDPTAPPELKQLEHYHPFYNGLFVKYDSSTGNKYDILRHNMLLASKSSVLLHPLEMRIDIDVRDGANQQVDHIDTDWIEVAPKDISTYLYSEQPYVMPGSIGSLSNLKHWLHKLSNFYDAFDPSQSYYTENVGTQDDPKYKVKFELFGKWNDSKTVLGSKILDLIELAAFLFNKSFSSMGYSKNGLNNIKKNESAGDQIRLLSVVGQNLANYSKSISNNAEAGNGDDIHKLIEKIVDQIIEQINEIEDITGQSLGSDKAGWQSWLTHESAMFDQLQTAFQRLVDPAIYMVTRIVDFIGAMNSYLDVLAQIKPNINTTLNHVQEAINASQVNNIISSELTSNIILHPYITLRVEKDAISDYDNFNKYMNAVLNNTELQLEKGFNIFEWLKSGVQTITATVSNLFDSLKVDTVGYKGIVEIPSPPQSASTQAVPIQNIMPNEHFPGNYWMAGSTGLVEVDGVQKTVEGGLTTITFTTPADKYVKEGNSTKVEMIDVNQKRIKISDPSIALQLGDTITLYTMNDTYDKEISILLTVTQFDSGTKTITVDEPLSDIVANYTYAEVYKVNNQTETSIEKIIGDLIYYDGSKYHILKAKSQLEECLKNPDCIYDRKIKELEEEIHKLVFTNKDNENSSEQSSQSANSPYVDTSGYKIGIKAQLRLKDQRVRNAVYSLYSPNYINLLFSEADQPRSTLNPKISHNMLAGYRIDPVPTNPEGITYIPIVAAAVQDQQLVNFKLDALENKVYTIDDIGIIEHIPDAAMSLDFNILDQTQGSQYLSLLHNNKVLGSLYRPALNDKNIGLMSIQDLEHQSGNDVMDLMIYKQAYDFVINKIKQEDSSNNQEDIETVPYSVKSVSPIGLVITNLDTAENPTRYGGWFVRYSLKYIDPEQEFLTKSLSKEARPSTKSLVGIYFANAVNSIYDMWFHIPFYSMIDINSAINIINKRYDIEPDTGISVDRQRKKFKQGIIDAIGELNDARLSIEITDTDGVLFSSDKMINLKCKLNV